MKKSQASQSDDHLQQRILECILDSPGINQKQLAERLSVHPNTIRHHEKRLEKMGLISRIRVGHCVYYFPKNKRSAKSQAFAAVLNNTPKRRIIQVISQEPGICGSEVARQLGRSPSTVKRHIDMMLELGILKVRSHSNSIGLEIHPEIQSEAHRFFQEN